MNVDYKILPVPTSKDSIKQPELAKNLVIAPIGSSIILVGKSGSGKTTLLYRLLMDKQFYNKNEYFKKIFLISPSGESDDIQKALNIPPSCVFTDLTIAIDALQKIMKHQEDSIKKHGAAKSSQFAVIFDDVIGNTKFMNAPEFTKSFIACRHFGLTTFLCSQHLRRIPRVCRLQAAVLYLFAVSAAEAEVLAEEQAPPGIHKKNFIRMVDDVLKEKYSFLTIMLKSPWNERFRSGLAMVIDLNNYKIDNTSAQTSSNPVAVLPVKQETRSSQK